MISLLFTGNCRPGAGTPRICSPCLQSWGRSTAEKTLVALTALEQVGLIAAVERGGAKFWELVPTAGKKNLADAPILKCLEEL